MSFTDWPLIPVLFWLALFLFLGKIPLIGRRSDGNRRQDEHGRVSVIIPARNEERGLVALLDSLARQSERPFEVIVVDDNSEDETARMASARGAKLLELRELPQGWTGKTQACWRGALSASGEILLFLDSDTVLEQDGLKRILPLYLQAGGIVSVQPYHRMDRAYERLSAFFNLIQFLNMNISSPVSRLNAARGAFGPCLVCGRQDYFLLGGHRAVKDDVVEDMALARLALDKGMPVRSFAGKGVISFRMYAGGLKDLIEGWTKNFATGAARSSPVLFLITFGWVAGALAGPLHIVHGVAAEHVFRLQTGLVLYAIFSAQICLFLAKLGNFHVLTAAMYPIHLVFFLFVCLRSVVYTGLVGHVRWKGRMVSLRKRGNLP